MTLHSCARAHVCTCVLGCSSHITPHAIASHPVTLQQVTQTFLRVSKRLGASVDAMQVRSPKPQTTNHKPQTTNHKPQTTNHKPQTTNHKPQTTNHKPQTSNHKPQTPNHNHNPSNATSNPRAPPAAVFCHCRTGGFTGTCIVQTGRGCRCRAGGDGRTEERGGKWITRHTSHVTRHTSHVTRTDVQRVPERERNDSARAMWPRHVCGGLGGAGEGGVMSCDV